MDIVTQIKLGMATRVIDFNRANPFPDPKDAAVAQKLETTKTRAEGLAGQQVGGLSTVHFSSVQRKDVRRELQSEPLRHLGLIATAASGERPDILARFQLPSGNASHLLFFTMTRAILQATIEEKDLLLKYGMSTTLIDDFTALLAQYEQAGNQGNAGRRAHTGARSDLGGAMREVMRLVHQLDGMNRYRFRENLELLGAWESARNAAWRKESQAAPAPAPSPQPGSTTASKDPVTKDGLAA